VALKQPSEGTCEGMHSRAVRISAAVGNGQRLVSDIANWANEIAQSRTVGGNRSFLCRDEEEISRRRDSLDRLSKRERAAKFVVKSSNNTGECTSW
jgi:hypothetical protein